MLKRKLPLLLSLITSLNVFADDNNRPTPYYLKQSKLGLSKIQKIQPELECLNNLTTLDPLTNLTVLDSLINASEGLNTVIDNRKNKWELTQFIWNIGFIAVCDIGINQGPIEYFESDRSFDPTPYQNIKNGDIVWIQSSWVTSFYKQIMPNVKYPFVLIVNDGDESFPSNSCIGFDPDELINHKMIIHIFAQNCDYKGLSSKISHLPIAVDFHSAAYRCPNGIWCGETGSPLEQEAQLKSILKGLKPTSERLKRAFVDFQHSDTMHAGFNRYLEFGEDRSSIFKQLLSTGLIDYSSPMKRSSLWLKKGEYAFSISPPGNGIDCHRTWEDLILGCIVIVKTSPLDPIYEGLPVVIINDWADITDKNMELWINQFRDAFTDPSYREKLTIAYWFNKIRSVTKQNTSDSLLIYEFQND